MPFDALLDFWFSLPQERWWTKDPAFDALLAERFLALHEAVARGEHDAWRETARGALATVIALDQLPRNLFRGTPRAFATDPAARAATRDALDRGFDHALGVFERGFLYMPLMHSEDPADQARCVALFAAHGPPAYVGFAEQHRAIVDRFGRFPHRNAVLGRASTPEEEAFLREPGSSF